MDFIRSILLVLYGCDQWLAPTNFSLSRGLTSRSTFQRCVTLFALFLMGMLHTTSAIADSGWCINTMGGMTVPQAFTACQQVAIQTVNNGGGWSLTRPCYVVEDENLGAGSFSIQWGANIYRPGQPDTVGAAGACDGVKATPSPAKPDGVPCACSRVADPINAGTGNAYRREEDFHSGRWLTFARYYNSDRNAGLDTIGQHWRHSYASHLNYVAGTSGTGTVTITREDGRVSSYALVNGVWAGEPDIPDALTEQTDTNGNPTGWTLLRVDTRSTEQFNATGQLISIQDANGFVTTLNYSIASTPTSVAPGSGYLISVVDPQQRTIQFT